jgi:xanthine/uracil/vitamin C permease (AzgA family)
VSIGFPGPESGRCPCRGGHGILAEVAAVTALVAGVMTIVMGVVANFPLALATGLGLNAFVTFGIAKLPGMTWADAMGLVVIEGLIILVLVLTGFRTAVFHAVPVQLKTAISVGIGLFITVIGFVDAGFVRRTATGPVPVEFGIVAATVAAMAILLVFTLMLADFFDTMGTMVAIGGEAGLLDEEGVPPNTGRILVVDSLAAAAGGAANVSSSTSSIESASGVGEGARAGLASVVTTGIGAGFISCVVLKLVRGKAPEAHPLLWVASALFVIYFAIDPIKELLGVG